MAADIATAAELLQPLLEGLYELGKDRFSKALAKIKNAHARQRLARKVWGVQKVKTFWQRDKEVPLSSFYYPSKIVFPGNQPKGAPSLAQLPKLGNFVILGTVGQGKSMFLRHLCVQELTPNGSGRIPVFVELRNVTDKGLMNSLFRAIEALDLQVDEDLFDFYAQSGKFVLLLDAFDELEDVLVKDVIGELEQLCSKYESLQILVTSRPGAAISDCRHFRVAQLAILTRVDHEPFLKKIGVTGPELRRLQTAIERSSTAVADLLTTPLMLTLLVVVYRAENQIPSELPDFYEKLFQTLFSRHDSAKPGFVRRHATQISERRLQQVFEAFCFACLSFGGRLSLSPENFDKAFQRAMKYVSIPCDEEAFRHDMTKVTCLLKEEGFELQFIHKSIAEFFAASFVRHQNPDTAARIYAQLLGRGAKLDQSWMQVLKFLAQIDPYGYAVHFEIPSLEKLFTDLGISAGTPSPQDGRKLAEAMLEGSYFVYFASAAGKKTPLAPGHIGRWIWLRLHDELNLAMPRVVRAAFAAEARNRKGQSIEEIAAAFPDGTLTPHGSLSVPYRRLMDEEGFQQAGRTAEECVSALRQKLRVLREFVAKERQIGAEIQII